MAMLPTSITRLSDPPPLIHLALKKLEEYIVSEYRRCVILKMTNQDINIKPVCKHLQTMMNSLPLTLANDVTELLTKTLGEEVDKALFDLLCESTHLKEEELIYDKFTSPSKLHIFEGFLEIAQCFAHAIFHSSVTSLCINVATVEEVTHKIKNFRNPQGIHSDVDMYFLRDWLQFLRKPLQIQIEPFLLCRLLSKFSKLEEFVFNVCKDEDLAILCLTCPDIKILNLRNSLITDHCVEYMMKFQHLKELDISRTQISHIGLKRFYEICYRNRQFSRKILKLVVTYNEGFSNLAAKDLALSMPKLRSLSLELDRACDLLTFWNLKNLTVFSVSSLPCATLYSFPYVAGFLKYIGGQIKSLSLSFVDGVDLKFICKYLPNLTHLSLTVRNCASLGIDLTNEVDFTNDKTQVLKFTSVKFLELYVVFPEEKPMMRILSWFVNLKKMETHLPTKITRKIIRLMNEDWLTEISLHINCTTCLNYTLRDTMLYVAENGKTLYKVRFEEFLKLTDEEY